MKAILLLVGFVLFFQHSSTLAQEIRLDSLWAKQGGVAAMTFTPDSKTLLIGEDGESGQVTVHNVADGLQRTPFFLPPGEYADFKFTPDGKYLVVSERDKVVLLNPQTFDSVGVIENVSTPGFLSFSEDSRYAAVAGWYYGTVVVDLSERTVKAILNRPDSYVPDPKHPMITEPYWNGRVSFSLDGTYIIGKYENSLVRWDWKNTPTKPEIVIGDFGNRAVIGFSPDKKYLVQQSNYLWDLVEKKQITIDGMASGYDENSVNAVFTVDGKYLFCLEKTLVTIVNIDQKKVAYATGRLATNMAVSADNSYYTFFRPDKTRVYHMILNPNSVKSDPIFSPVVLIKPQPGKEFITIEVESPNIYSNCDISVISSLGTVVGNIYKGSISIGKQTFIFSTSNLSSGQYSLVMSSKGQTNSFPFIITK